MSRQNKIRAVSLTLLSVALALGLWPLTTVNPIADDLHLLAQGSGLMRQEGFASVLRTWSTFDLNSAHLTPLGGVFTTFHVWVINQISMRTPLTIEDAWGLARMFWVIAAVVAACWFVRTVLRDFVPWSWSWHGTSFVLLTIIQVHGYWSNDPVVAFPIASWAFCIIGFVYLGLTWRHIWSASKPSVASWILLTGVSLTGVLTYELFLAFLVSSSLMYTAAFVAGNRSNSKVKLPFVLFSLLPGVLLVLSQLIRLSQGSSYSGTTISLGGASVVSVFLMALLSALPGASIRIAIETLPRFTPSRVFLLMVVASLIVLLTIAVQGFKNSKSAAVERGPLRVSHLLIAMIGLWFSATGIISLTPKYQQEMNGVLGKVYVNYAPSWLAVGVGMSVVLAYLLSRKLLRMASLLLSALFVFGIVHTWLNLSQIDVLARDSSWSTNMLRSLESRPEDNENRCRQAEVLFALPWPEYYQNEILDGLQKTYSGSYGIPYCRFTADDGRVRILTRPLGGTYPIEFLPDGRRIVWGRERVVDLQLINSSEDSMHGFVELKASLPPCSSAMGLIVDVNDRQSKYDLTTVSPTIALRFGADIPPGQSIRVTITQIGSGCNVVNDPRTLWSMIELPVFVKS